MSAELTMLSRPIDWSRVMELLTSGRLDAAERALRAVREQSPNPIAETIIRARIEWERGRPGQAIELLTEATKTFPQASSLHTALAELFLLLDRTDLAFRHAAEAKRIGVTPAAGVTLKKLRRTTPAPRDPLQALLGASLFPENVSPKTMMVRAPRAKTRFKLWLIAASFAALAGGAYVAAQLAISRRSEQEAAHVARDLRQLLKLGSFDAASAVADRLRGLVGQARIASHDDLLFLGDALLFKYHGGAAPSQLRARSGSVDARVAEALIAEGRNKPWALEKIEALAEADLSDVHLRMLLARARARAGRNDAAARAFDEAAALEPANLAYAVDRLEFLLQTQRVREARDLRDHVHDVSPSSIWAARADVLLRRTEP